jgi:hypothetical protein
MPRTRWNGIGLRAAPLDRKVLDLMSEFPGEITFAGLRRTLGAHQESLSRTLHRLERDGAVERTDLGYRISERAMIPGGASGHPRFPMAGESPVTELRLTREEDVTRILGFLAGRWFGEFRWIGSFEDGPRTTLLWRASHRQDSLALVVEGCLLRVYHRAGNPSAGTEPPAAYELLQQALRGLQRTAPAPRATGTLHLSLLREVPAYQGRAN